MSGNKGMKQDSVSMRTNIKEEHESGRSVRESSRDYGISRSAVFRQ